MEILTYFKVMACRNFRSSHTDIIAWQEICLFPSQTGIKSKNLIINHKTQNDSMARTNKPPLTFKLQLANNFLSSDSNITS